MLRKPETNKYKILFDPVILEVIRETKFMLEFGLEIPYFVKIIHSNQGSIIANYETLRTLVKKNDALRRSVPPMLLNLMTPYFVELEKAFQPCLAVVSWTSLRIKPRFKNILDVINKFESFVQEIKNMKEQGIKEPLAAIGHLRLVQFEDSVQNPEEFSGSAVEYAEKIAEEIEKKSSAIEIIAIKTINRFIDLINDPTIGNDKYNWIDLKKVCKVVTSKMKLAEQKFELGKMIIL